MKVKRLLGLTMMLILSACASIPDAPHVNVLPAKGVTLEQFRLDDLQCREFAQDQISDDISNKSAMETLTDIAIGSAVGALAGQAIGHNTHGTVTGLAIGAGLGLATGAYQAHKNSEDAQRHYDSAYQQCMSIKGHVIR